MNPNLAMSPRVTYLVLALLAAAAPVAAPAAAQEDATTTARGAPDPCGLVTEAEAGAVAGVPMHRRASEPKNDLGRSCTYVGKAPGGAGAMSLRVVTYQCICEPAAMVRRLEQNDWGNTRFQHEPELGPLTTSLVMAGSAQVMGFKGRTGLTVHLASGVPGLDGLTRRGFAIAMKKLP
jgi:hypothetical protein